MDGDEGISELSVKLWYVSLSTRIVPSIRLLRLSGLLYQRVILRCCYLRITLSGW